ncbi:hypothetical protein GZH47_00225 [Paenibacillus rhizovicinus]|uniref:Uncharacterized protein n=1 Tax=Paenibacillus rhizovicinus TaxID=2704463 RepID=A0A6C0P8H5_9BACL|nr:hypothetical protein GZH47_00225 [Paenibacillus rhizovicinus]
MRKSVRNSANGSRSSKSSPTFTRLTVVWVNLDGVTFNTTGFFARLFRNGQLVSTASFDRYGVVRFNNINTLTSFSYNIRTYDANGLEYRSRNIPAGVQTYAIIG